MTNEEQARELVTNWLLTKDEAGPPAYSGRLIPAITKALDAAEARGEARRLAIEAQNALSHARADERRRVKEILLLHGIIDHPVDTPRMFCIEARLLDRICGLEAEDD